MNKRVILGDRGYADLKYAQRVKETLGRTHISANTLAQLYRLRWQSERILTVESIEELLSN